MLIQKQLVTFHEEFRSLLQQEKKDDLGRMYLLVARLEDALGDMKDFLETHIWNQGLDALNQLSEGAQTVSSFIKCFILSRTNSYSNFRIQKHM